MCGYALLASSPHGLHEVYQCSLRDIQPLLLKQAQQFLHICRRWVVLPDPATKEIPEVLNGRKVRGTSWPVHAVNPLLLQKVSDDVGTMRGSIVVL